MDSRDDSNLWPWLVVRFFMGLEKFITLIWRENNVNPVTVIVAFDLISRTLLYLVFHRHIIHTNVHLVIVSFQWYQVQRGNPSVPGYCLHRSVSWISNMAWYRSSFCTLRWTATGELLQDRKCRSLIVSFLQSRSVIWAHCSIQVVHFRRRLFTAEWTYLYVVAKLWWLAHSSKWNTIFY